MASVSPTSTYTRVRSPDRSSRASCTASRWVVRTRSPAVSKPQENRFSVDSRYDDGYCPLVLACGPDGDLHVLPQGGEKVQEALDGEGARAVAHQGGDVRLLDAEELSRFSLGQAARFDEAVNVQRQPGFQEFLCWLGQAEVGEDVPAAFFYPDRFFGSCGHVNAAFLCGAVRPQPGGGG